MKKAEIRKKIENGFLIPNGFNPQSLTDTSPISDFGIAFIPFCAQTFKVGTMEEYWHPDITLGEVLEIIANKTGAKH